jgi:hypothetical protein
MSELPGSANHSGPTAIELTVRVAVHGLLCSCTAAVLALAVPRFVTVFDEYQLSLPALTKAVLSASHWLTQHWHVVAVVLLPALTAWWVGLALLRLSTSTRRVVHPLCVAMTAVVLFANVVIAVAVVLPWVKVQEALAR